MKTKKVSAFICALVAMTLLAAPLTAHRWERSQSDNPLQLVAWVLHPVGLAGEYVIYRPMHWLVSQSYLDIVFGHKSHPNDDKYFFEFKHGDFTPSIRDERRRMYPERYAEPEMHYENGM